MQVNLNEYYNTLLVGCCSMVLVHRNRYIYIFNKITSYSFVQKNFSNDQQD